MATVCGPHDLQGRSVALKLVTGGQYIEVGGVTKAIRIASQTEALYLNEPQPNYFGHNHGDVGIKTYLS